MSERIVTKNLAGIEDLLLGKGTEQQIRNGNEYPITKLSLPWVCSDTVELLELDTTKFTQALVSGIAYKYDGSAWVKVSDNTLREDLAATGGAELVGFQQSGTGAVARTTNSKLREIASVKDFGAVGDGVSDDSAAIKAALDYLKLNGGGRIHFPRGQYLCTNNSAVRIAIQSNAVLTGDGMRESVLKFNDSASTSPRDLIRTDNGGRYNIELHNLGFDGDWGANGDWTARSHLIQLFNVGNVLVDGCRFSNSRKMGFICTGASRVKVVNCEFDTLHADGCRPCGAQEVIIANNTFVNVNDDSIAIHSFDYDSFPATNSAVVVGNSITDSQGIAVLGAKSTIITANRLVRPHTRGINVSAEPAYSEGNTSLLNVVITGNVIDTLFSGDVFSALSGSWQGYIHVNPQPPSALPSGGYLGQPNSSGGMNPYRPELYLNNTDNTGRNAGSWNIQISNNVCVRTLGAVGKYSDYGYGVRYGRSGPVNPQITAATLGYGGSTRPAVRFQNHSYNVMMANNIISGMDSLVEFAGGAGTAYRSYGAVLLSGCHFSDWSYTAVRMEANGQFALRNCSFDGDPNHSHSARLPNGKWSSNYGLCSGFRASSSTVVEVSGCSFRNLGVINSIIPIADVVWANNTIYADPAVESGYLVDNIGIGLITYPARLGARLSIEDGDPSSPTYGKLKNTCLEMSDAPPTTGKYVIGQIVRKYGPALVGAPGSQYMVVGWWRSTNGTSHVLGVDWREIRTPA